MELKRKELCKDCMNKAIGTGEAIGAFGTFIDNLIKCSRCGKEIKDRIYRLV